MIKDPRNRFLCEKAGELASGGGQGAAVLELQPGAEAGKDAGEGGGEDDGKDAGEGEKKEEGEEPAASAQREPSRLEMVAASIQSKGKLLARATDAEAKLLTAEQTIATQRAEIERLTGVVTTVTQERESARAELVKIDALLKQAGEEKQTVEDAAAERVAALGFSAVELPKADAEPVKTAAELSAEADKERDPNKRWELATAASEARWNGGAN